MIDIYRTEGDNRAEKIAEFYDAWDAIIWARAYTETYDDFNIEIVDRETGKTSDEW